MVKQEKLSQKNNYLSSIKKAFRVPLFDVPFFVCVVALLVVGLLMLYSTGFATAYFKTGDSYYYISNQLRNAIIGFVIMLGVSFFPYNQIKRWSIVPYLLAVALLALVLILPSNDTEKRWIYIFGRQFQPSEIAKIAVIIMLADYLSNFRKKLGSAKYGILIPGVIIAIPVALIGLEPHLSGAILVTAVALIVMFCGGCKIRHLVAVLSAGAAGAIALLLSKSYMMKRITTWLNPESDILGDGWQIVQSLITIGSGGVFGLGYGKSRQKYLYMSEPQNDFIFSVVCEEIGYIGALFIIALFAFLVWRGIYIAMHAPDTFSSLVVVGITARIAVQVILNFCVVSNSVPVTGIPLPFFSYGGTALIVLLGEMGIVLQISRFSQTEKGT